MDDYSEDDLQKYAAYVLTDACKKTLWFHVPNGGKRNKVTAALLKKFGVKPGVADILIFRPRRSNLAVEVKTKTGVQSDDQKKFQLHWEQLGGIYVIVRTPEQIEALIPRFGLD